MTKIAFVIQARMASNRLPGKVLLPLPIQDNIPMLEHIVRELQKTTHGKHLIVATSSETSDDAIAEFCRSKKIDCYRGASSNVLSRFQEVAKKGDFDHIIRYTGDNPFVDIPSIEKTVSYHLQENADLTFPSGLPLGIHSEIIKVEALLDLSNKKLISPDKEHVTWYFKRTEEYKVSQLNFFLEEPIRNLRLTVDYPEDLIVASTLLSLKKSYPNKSGLSLITAVFADFPWIFEINSTKIQKNPPSNLKEELELASTILKSLDLSRAANILKQQTTR